MRQPAARAIDRVQNVYAPTRRDDTTTGVKQICCKPAANVAERAHSTGRPRDDYYSSIERSRYDGEDHSAGKPLIHIRERVTPLLISRGFPFDQQ